MSWPSARRSIPGSRPSSIRRSPTGSTCSSAPAPEQHLSRRPCPRGHRDHDPGCAMSLSTVYAALQRHLTGTAPNQTIDLHGAASDPDLHLLGPALDALRVTTAFTVTGATLTSN